MDVRYSPEQVALRDAAAHLVERLGPKAVGQLDDRERADKLDAALAATGWRELRAGDGGAPLAGGVEVALVAEQLAQGLADAAFVGPTLAGELRRLAGLSPADAPETVLAAPDLADVACLPLGADAAGLAVDAAGAARALALTPAAGGHRVVAVALAPSPLEPVDLTRTVARPAGTPHLLDGGAVVADADLERWRALALAVTAADLVGAMQGAVDLARQHVTVRQQYGAPIGSFQAVQHLLADALVATEGSRSATLHAAWAVDALAPAEALAAGAAAKAYASRAARSVCETVIQVHGGLGHTWECLAHVFLRRTLLSTGLLGGADANLERVLAHHGVAAERRVA